MTLDVGKARADAAKAAEKAAEAEQRRIEAEQADAERRVAARRAWAEKFVATFDAGERELEAAERDARASFRLAVYERHEPGIAEYVAWRTSMTNRWMHGRKLQDALGALGQLLWHGHAIPAPATAHFKAYVDAVSEVLDAQAHDIGEQAQEAHAAELQALEATDGG